MVRPTITYNSSTGSSTSSGSGESKITGSTATVVGGDPGTVIQLDGSPDLSGLTADTSAIWLSGIGLYRITAVNDGADQVTVHTSVSLSSGVSWGIGGTRDNPRSDTFRDEATGEAGWTYEFESGTYDMDDLPWQPVAGDTTNGRTVTRAKAGYSTKPIFKITSYLDVALPPSWHTIQEIHFQGRQYHACVEIDNISHLIVDRCHFEMVATEPNAYGYYSTTGGFNLVVRGCTFEGKSISGCQAFLLNGGRLGLRIIGCEVYGFASMAFNKTVDVSFGEAISIEDCIFRDSGYGIRFIAAQDSGGTIRNCVLHGNANDGFYFEASQADGGMLIENCIFTENGGYGIRASTTAYGQAVLSDYNAFRNNTSGARSNVAAGANDVTLTADPYTSEGTDDYTLNSTAGGGAACRQAGYPDWS